ncbi:MAG: TAXI family TRAP transporter solute-binding subunit [Desulfurococcales archaeon]|nr:TAXI family TRAP transporter solute-binding subunit [Desulfurococcales archaeon]
MRRQRRGLSSSALAAIVVIIIIIAAAGLYVGMKGKGTTTTTSGTSTASGTGQTTTSTSGGAKPYKLTILTGSTAGTYYPVGTSYAKLLDKYSNGLIQANAVEGRASVGNIKDLCAGTGQAALAQNDISYYAYHGKVIKDFENHPMTCIRAVAVLYPETIQIVTTADSGINSIQDLAGKKVAVGAQGSGTYWNARQILEAAGVWDKIIPEYKKFSEIVQDLKLGNIDAAFLTAGIPTSAVEQLAAETKIKIIPVPTDIYNKLKQKYPFYIQQTIPAKTYSGQTEPVQTVAVMSMLIVRSDVPNNVVYTMVKILFDHADELKQMVGKQSVQYISLDHALQGLSIPLHPGAYQYYQEQGIKVPDQFKPPANG